MKCLPVGEEQTGQEREGCVMCGRTASLKKKGWRGRRRRTGYRRSLVSSGYSPHQDKSNMGP